MLTGRGEQLVPNNLRHKSKGTFQSMHIYLSGFITLQLLAAPSVNIMATTTSTLGIYQILQFHTLLV